MSKNIYTIAVLKAKPGRLGDLKATLTKLAKETRKEAGANEYFFIQDENHDPNTIVSYERWENATEEKNHWNMPHLKAAIREMRDILDGEPQVHRGYKII